MISNKKIFFSIHQKLIFVVRLKERSNLATDKCSGILDCFASRDNNYCVTNVLF